MFGFGKSNNRMSKTAARRAMPKQSVFNLPAQPFTDDYSRVINHIEKYGVTWQVAEQTLGITLSVPERMKAQQYWFERREYK